MAGEQHIDCAECVMQHTSACDDCVVSFIVGREPGEAIVIDVAEARALRNLSGGRARPRAPSPAPAAWRSG